MLGTYGHDGVVAAISFGREEYPSVGRVVDEFSHWDHFGLSLLWLSVGSVVWMSFS
jgi:hypothetical protein